MDGLAAPIIGRDIKIKDNTAKILPCVKEKAGTASSPKDIALTTFPTTSAFLGPSTRSLSQLPTITNSELHAPIAAIMLAASP